MNYMDTIWGLFKDFNAKGSELYMVNPAPVGARRVGIIESWHPIRVWPTLDQDGNVIRMGFRVVFFGTEWFYDQHSGVHRIDVSDYRWEEGELVLETQDVPMWVTPFADEDSEKVMEAWKARLSRIPKGEVSAIRERLLEQYR